jgi:signal transduction histidine kinase
LIAQAIKFTKSESKRVINISLGASIGPPSAFDDLGVIWFSNGTSPDDVNLNDNPTLETDMCLYFAVKDTGQGLDPNEIGRLSKRFYQASQKTHIYVCCAECYVGSRLID